jgi:acetylornithine deacetylase/succinyl-diaminopimelate desuccinylase-like protein
MKVEKKALAAWAAKERGRFEETLKQFVEIPSVSADPAHEKDVHRCADAAVRLIRDSGGKAKIIKTDGHPIVHGKFKASSSAPTLTIYNHMDVQPASRETEPWNTEPFVFTKKGNRYFGRGTTDDKGPALSALWAIRAAREARIPLNINVLWELEEEIGSPNFEAAIKRNADELATDHILVSDTIWVSRQTPACPAGLRGLQGMSLSLTTAKTDQHSGVTGGAARNPLGELMQLISQMYDARTGKVKMPGFYDDVEAPTEEELDDFRNSGFSVKQFKKDHDFRSIRSENALDVMRRIWALPTMEVHGVIGGYTGPGIKTVIPPSAEVKVSFRLVPNQDPRKIQKLVREFVKQKNPDVKIEIENQMWPYKAPTTGALPDAIRDAMKFSFGKEPVFVREGGSIGAVVSMEKVLKSPVMFLGLSLPEHGYHAPNENYDWQQASGGIVAFVKYFENLAKMGR